VDNDPAAALVLFQKTWEVFRYQGVSSALEHMGDFEGALASMRAAIDVHRRNYRARTKEDIHKRITRIACSGWTMYYAQLLALPFFNNAGDRAGALAALDEARPIVQEMLMVDPTDTNAKTSAMANKSIRAGVIWESEPEQAVKLYTEVLEDKAYPGDIPMW